MKDMERQKFENDFKDAFEQAGITPSDNLWTGIELDLEKAESKKMKRMLLVYKLMAAASITFAMSLAGAYYYAGFTNSNRDLARNATTNDRSEEMAQTVTSVISSKKSDTNSSVASASQDETLSGNNGTHKDLNNITTAVSDEARITGVNRKVKKEKAEHGVTQTLIADNSEKTNTSRNNEKYSNVGNENRKNENDDGENNVTSSLAVNNSDKNNSNINNENYSARSSEKLIKSETGAATVGANKTRSSNDANIPLNVENNRRDELTEVSLNDKKLPPIIQLKKIEFDFPATPKPDPFAIMMAKLELREKELMEEGEPKKKNKTNRSEKLWTSVGFAAGSFNSSSHTSSTGSAVTPAQSLVSSGFSSSTSSRVASNESSASGASYSMGLNLGTKITNRWIMQGGVNYLMQNSSYQTDVVVSSSNLSSFRAASIAEFKTANSGANSDKVVSTAMYNVNNNSQFVSIPVQAGYLAVNRKVGFQINAGVSTDLFLKNIKDPQGVDIETTTQGRGSDSPYRPLNFSGLFGTELSYKLGQHYRLAINPGLRYPFNSIYKSGVGVTSNPLTMDIGMRFRYIFR